jgi:putative membrane protein
MNDMAAPTDPRIYLAAERTFLAWVRTGIAFMGFGFVIARFGLFLREIANGNQAAMAREDSLFSLPVGITLIVAGIVIILVAALRHRRYVRALDRGQFRQVFGVALILLVAAFLAIIGLAMAVYLAFLLK